MSNLLSAFRLATLPSPTNAFRAEVKAFLQTHMDATPPDIRARSWMGFNTAFSQKLAARGWVGVTLPAQYGGAQLDAFSRFVLVDRQMRVRAFYPTDEPDAVARLLQDAARLQGQ